MWSYRINIFLSNVLVGFFILERINFFLKHKENSVVFLSFFFSCKWDRLSGYKKLEEGHVSYRSIHEKL